MDRSKGDRNASTAIYFLIDGENFSAFHRIASDEMWHFYAGSTLTVEVIDPAGRYSQILVGNHPEAGEEFQAVVPAGCWFASHVKNPHSYSLVGLHGRTRFRFRRLRNRPANIAYAEFPNIARLSNGSRASAEHIVLTRFSGICHCAGTHAGDSLDMPACSVAHTEACKQYVKE